MDSWLVDHFKGVGYGGGPGFKPADSQQYFLHITKLIKNEETRVSTRFTDNRPIQMCHVFPLPHQHDGTTLHVAVRIVQTGTVSTPIFSLFDLAVKSQYILHTDSIRENKYTTRIRKTRRTQWNCFRLNPSTLKIEQILIP
jgi:hypothetical protein